MTQPEVDGDFNNVVETHQIERIATLVHDSRVKLETVLRLYYLRHGFDCWDIFLVQFLAVLAYASLEKMASYADTARQRVEAVSTLAFCVSIYAGVCSRCLHKYS